MPGKIYLDNSTGGGIFSSPGNRLYTHVLKARYFDLNEPLYIRVKRFLDLQQVVQTIGHLPRYIDLAQDLHGFVPAGYRLWAVNVATFAETLLGFIPNAAPLQLTGIALADGNYLIRVELEGYYWQRERQLIVFPVLISGGVVVLPLPTVDNLSYKFIGAPNTQLNWIWNQVAGTDQPTDFAIWTAAAAPVDTSGAPAYTVAATTPGAYSMTFSPAIATYVAACARKGATKGPIATLSIPRPPVVLTSPPNQFSRFN